MGASAERYARLDTILTRMARYNSVTRKFAEVLNGQTKSALLGYPEKETASLFRVSIKKNEIILVTAYNLTKKRRTHNRMRLLSHG